MRWLTELTREPSAVNPVAVGGILPTWPGACHVQSDALNPAGYSINHYNSGRISGEWDRPNGVLRFLWTYFFGMNANFSCRRGYVGQLLMRECQLLRDVFERGFQRSNRIFFPAGIFIDRSFISVNVRGMLLGVVSAQWEVEPNRRWQWVR